MVERNSATNAQIAIDQNSERLLINGAGFISENKGNIKDYYKISSCIGRGKFCIQLIF
jgi:hypothetical protein